MEKRPGTNGAEPADGEVGFRSTALRGDFEIRLMAALRQGARRSGGRDESRAQTAAQLATAFGTAHGRHTRP